MLLCKICLLRQVIFLAGFGFYSIYEIMKVISFEVTATCFSVLLDLELLFCPDCYVSYRYCCGIEGHFYFIH